MSGISCCVRYGLRILDNLELETETPDTRRRTGKTAEYVIVVVVVVVNVVVVVTTTMFQVPLLLATN